MSAPFNMANPPRFLINKITKKQRTAILGGTSLMLTMGFYIFWETYLFIYANQWNQYGDESRFHAAIGWHVAFIVGAVGASILVKRCQKKPIYFIAEGLVALSGLLMAISWDSLVPIVIARYFGGLGHGLAFFTTVVHSSEIALTNFRGKIMGEISTTINYSLWLGFLFLAVYSHFEEPSFLIDQSLGVFTVVLAAAGMACNMGCIESPIYHLERDEGVAAVICLKQLRHEWTKPEELLAEITEMESLVRIQESSKLPTVKATIRAVTLRGLYSMSNFFVFNLYAYFFIVLYFSPYAFLFAYSARAVGELFVLYFIDRDGRRPFLATSIASSGLCLLIIGVLFPNELDSWYAWGGLLFFCFNLFVGAGLSPISVILLGESFHPNKNWLPILLSVAIEHIVQIICISAFFYYSIQGQLLYLTVGLLYILISGLTYLFTPETKKLNLEKSASALS